MTLLDTAISDGGYVTTKGGNENVVTGTLAQVPGAGYMGQQWVGGLMIVLIMMFFVSMQMGYVQCMMDQDDGFVNDGHPSDVRFGGVHGQPSLSGFTNDYLKDRYARQSSFINTREVPYFNSAPNRDVAMEDRERAAVRKLASINRERQRKLDAAAAADAAAAGVSPPLAWGPFWKEWKENNQLDGEDTEGYSTDMEYRSTSGW